MVRYIFFYFRVLSVTFDRKRLATGSQDKTIRLWSLKDGRCLQTLTGHSKGIWCIRFFSKNMLISGSYDHTIKVSVMSHCVTKQTFIVCVHCVTFSNQSEWGVYLRISGICFLCMFYMMQVWNLREGSCLRTLLSHEGPVWAMVLQQNLLVSGSQDRTVSYIILLLADTKLSNNNLYLHYQGLVLSHEYIILRQQNMKC